MAFIYYYLCCSFARHLRFLLSPGSLAGGIFRGGPAGIPCLSFMKSEPLPYFLRRNFEAERWSGGSVRKQPIVANFYAVNAPMKNTRTNTDGPQR